jgi:transposase
LIKDVAITSVISFLRSFFVPINNICLDIKTLIKSFLELIRKQGRTIDDLTKKNTDLEAQLLIYKNKKNSNNSSIPPSKDQNRPKKNQSLREKSGKKPGGQQGHEGKTLLCSEIIDEIVEHKSAYCNCCGNDLSGLPETLIESRQVIDIPVIKPVCTEHRIYRKICNCGNIVESKFPGYVAAKVQYGPNTESLTGYLHARQYLPFERMKEFFTDVMGLTVSVGGVNNILRRFIKKATVPYEEIKERIVQSTFIGTDETSSKVNGKNDWMWAWQNDDLTFMVHSDNRGFKTIEDTFSDGLPNAVLQHDRYFCHFNCKAKHHQICTAHLLRDLKYLEQLYKECHWATEVKAVIIEALQLKKQLLLHQYNEENKERGKLMEKFDKLLLFKLNETHKKSRNLQKSLLKYQQYVFYFLYNPEVPPDNNGSERAIRNIRVKQKISGQFKSDSGADGFAILRSVIDTTIKSGQNVLNALSLIAMTGTE